MYGLWSSAYDTGKQNAMCRQKSWHHYLWGLLLVLLSGSLGLKMAPSEVAFVARN